jgi:hypothetical protein
MGALTASIPRAASPNFEVCPRCGDFTKYLMSETGWCKECTKLSDSRISLFLVANADHIEHYLAEGLSLREAIKRVATDVKPTCVICGKPMSRAKRNAVICRRTERCRYTARRYAYLYSRKGYTKAEALVEVMGSW